MPTKSCFTERADKKDRCRVERIITSKSSQKIQTIKYKTLDEVIKNAELLKSLSDWFIQTSSKELTLKKIQEPWTYPEFEIVIDDSLGYTVKIFQWLLPEDHEIYRKHKRSVRNTTLLNLVNEIKNYNVCQGVERSTDGRIIHHVVPLSCQDLDDDENNEEILIPFRSKTFYRLRECEILLKCENNEPITKPNFICLNCKSYKDSLLYQSNKKEKNIINPAKTKAPLSVTSKPKVVLALRQERLKCAQLTAELEKMKLELEKCSYEVDHVLHKAAINKIFMYSPVIYTYIIII